MRTGTMIVVGLLGGLVAALAVGCQGRHTQEAQRKPATTVAAGQPAQSETGTTPLGARDSGLQAKPTPTASTVTTLSPNTTSAAAQAGQAARAAGAIKTIDPAESAVTLRATRARIDVLTAKAATVVAKIEATPPDRIMLLRLDAAFIDTRRLMTTDKTLAELGRKMTTADKAAAQRYSKGVYEKLKGRVAAAGKRHREAAAKAAVNTKPAEAKPAASKPASAP